MSDRWVARVAQKSIWHRIAVFSVVCGLLITPLDSLQVAVGVESVAERPWIITIQFAVVGAVIAVLSKLIEPDPSPEPLSSLMLSAVMFVGGYLCTTPQAKGTASTTLVYYIFLLAVLTYRAYQAGVLAQTALFALILAVLGSLTEGLDVYFGGFSYHPPTVLGIPIWLPLLYASAAPLVRGLAAEMSPQAARAEAE